MLELADMFRYLGRSVKLDELQVVISQAKRKLTSSFRHVTLQSLHQFTILYRYYD